MQPVPVERPHVREFRLDPEEESAVRPQSESGGDGGVSSVGAHHPLGHDVRAAEEVPSTPRLDAPELQSVA